MGCDARDEVVDFGWFGVKLVERSDVHWTGAKHFE